MNKNSTPRGIKKPEVGRVTAQSAGKAGAYIQWRWHEHTQEPQVVLAERLTAMGHPTSENELSRFFRGQCRDAIFYWAIAKINQTEKFLKNPKTGKLYTHEDLVLAAAGMIDLEEGYNSKP